jgi:hypothetical protein
MRNGSGTGPLTIHGYEVYDFSRTVGEDTIASSSSSYNEVKKFAGFLGFVDDSDGDPLEGVKVVIYNPKGQVLATLYTDADGYYMYAYKHTSKSATYTVKLPGYAKSVSVLVKANGFAAVDFEIQYPNAGRSIFLWTVCKGFSGAGFPAPVFFHPYPCLRIPADRRGAFPAADLNRSGTHHRLQGEASTPLI